MGRLIGRRLLFLLPVLFGILLAVFVTMRIVPGDPARLVAGPDAGPEELATIRQQFGLDRPLHVQFERYVLDILRGEFGRSLKTQRPVLDEIVPRLGNTALLAVLSTLFAVIVGLLAGIVAAARRNSAFDHATMVVAMLGVSTPSFYLGIVLIVVFAVMLRLFPAGGSGGLAHLVLPAVTLGASTLGIVARMTRASMIDVLDEDYIRTARAKGVRERLIVARHALRNALLPVIAVVALQFGFVLAGSVLVETVFSFPGIGWLIVESISMRDFPVVQGSILLVTFVSVLVNLAADILYGYADPRVKY
ncbi:MAG TPA: ABC transporter permease [Methylomirabilota bacterium]|jgi:ABC-type dipeptide/oligopeptide/nickel transport system permease component|nr:ABC transporter permease [Methylomirabilota bacterium]